MARMSIYIPDGLKAEMDRFGDQVTWSNVAQHAFHAEIAKRDFPEDPTMEDVIKRLADSKKEELEDGRKDGRYWAKHTASYKELKLLSKLDVDDVSNPEWGTTGAEVVDDHMRPATKDWRSDTRRDFEESFWFPFAEDLKDISDEYAAGFVEGAQEVWAQVEDKL